MGLHGHNVWAFRVLREVNDTEAPHGQTRGLLQGFTRPSVAYLGRCHDKLGQNRAMRAEDGGRSSSDPFLHSGESFLSAGLLGILTNALGGFDPKFCSLQ